jgi:hypothetical protein
LKRALRQAGEGVAIPAERCRRQPLEYGKHLYQARRLTGRFFNELDQSMAAPSSETIWQGQ